MEGIRIQIGLEIVPAVPYVPKVPNVEAFKSSTVQGSTSDVSIGVQSGESSCQEKE
jgi:hypothetical protein